MNYLRRDNIKRSRKRDNKDIMIGLIIVLILIAIFYIFSRPLLNLLYWGEGIISHVWQRPQTVIRSVDDAAYIEALQADNDQLRNLLGQKTIMGTTVLGDVIISPPKSVYDTIVVDVGQDQGVVVGDLVYAEGEYGIGTVSAVYAKSSLITLYSSSGNKENVIIGTGPIDPNSLATTTPSIEGDLGAGPNEVTIATTTAELNGSSTSLVIASSTEKIPMKASGKSSFAIAEGQGGGNFYIKLPRNVQVVVGDPVILQDTHTVLLGTIEKIDDNPGGTYSYLYFKSPVNINILRYVQIKEALH